MCFLRIRFILSAVSRVRDILRHTIGFFIVSNRCVLCAWACLNYLYIIDCFFFLLRAVLFIILNRMYIYSSRAALSSFTCMCVCIGRARHQNSERKNKIIEFRCSLVSRQYAGYIGIGTFFFPRQFTRTIELLKSVFQLKPGCEQTSFLRFSRLFTLWFISPSASSRVALCCSLLFDQIKHLCRKLQPIFAYCEPSTDTFVYTNL